VNQDLKVIQTVRHMLDHNRCVGTDVVTVTVEKSSLFILF